MPTCLAFFKDAPHEKHPLMLLYCSFLQEGQITGEGSVPSGTSYNRIERSPDEKYGAFLAAQSLPAASFCLGFIMQ